MMNINYQKWKMVSIGEYLVNTNTYKGYSLLSEGCRFFNICHIYHDYFGFPNQFFSLQMKPIWECKHGCMYKVLALLSISGKTSWDRYILYKSQWFQLCWDDSWQKKIETILSVTMSHQYVEVLLILNEIVFWDEIVHSFNMVNSDPAPTIY